MDFFEETARLIAARKATIAALAATPRELAIPDLDGRTVHLISREMDAPEVGSSRWRSTWLDGTGVGGHSGGTFEQALRSAYDYGADLARAVPVTPATVDSIVAGMGLVVGCESPPNHEKR